MRTIIYGPPGTGKTHTLLQHIEKFLEKNSFFDENKDEIEDFDFNQDIDFDDSNVRSPGWIRYQKKLK